MIVSTTTLEFKTRKSAKCKNPDINDYETYNFVANSTTFGISETKEKF